MQCSDLAWACYWRCWVPEAHAKVLSYGCSHPSTRSTCVGIQPAILPYPSRSTQVISLCEKARDPPLRYIVADTPGQIEIFTWSASGAIITDAFAATFPTMVRWRHGGNSAGWRRGGRMSVFVLEAGTKWRLGWREKWPSRTAQ